MRGPGGQTSSGHRRRLALAGPDAGGMPLRTSSEGSIYIHIHTYSHPPSGPWHCPRPPLPLPPSRGIRHAGVPLSPLRRGSVRREHSLPLPTMHTHTPRGMTIHRQSSIPHAVATDGTDRSAVQPRSPTPYTPYAIPCLFGAPITCHHSPTSSPAPAWHTPIRPSLVRESVVWGKK